MNKKLIALAVAAAVAAPAAMADTSVTLYGQVKAGVESVKVQDGVSKTRVSDETSKIGFKGEEDLGSGLKAIWQVESRVRPDDGGTSADTNAFASRNSFVGMAGGFGAVKLGRYDSPYKSLTPSGLNAAFDGIGDQGSGGYDPTTAGKGSGVFGQLDKRLKNVVLYESPVVVGFQAKAMYGTAENKAANTAVAPADNSVSNTDVYAVSALYSQPMFDVGFAYEQDKNGSNTDAATNKAVNGGKIEGYKGFAALKLAGLYLGAGYEQIKANDKYATKGKQKGWLLSASYTLGAIVPFAQYGKVGDAGDNSDTGSKQYTVGVKYDLSKRTYARALYTKLDNEANAIRDLSVNAVGAVKGKDVSGFNVGIGHSF